jgi:hypothetical protein
MVFAFSGAGGVQQELVVEARGAGVRGGDTSAALVTAHVTDIISHSLDGYFRRAGLVAFIVEEG